MSYRVAAVSRSEKHSFSKETLGAINLIENFGVEGDSHAGETVQHIFLAKKDPSRKNIRQVHLIQAELFSELKDKGFSVSPGQLGENITTKGIDLLGLPVGCKLHIGEQAIIKLTALRNPCAQVENFQKGMLKEVISKDNQGSIIRKAGVMAVVLTGGIVKPGDVINLELPEAPHEKLEYIW